MPPLSAVSARRDVLHAFAKSNELGNASSTVSSRDVGVTANSSCSVSSAGEASLACNTAAASRRTPQVSHFSCAFHRTTEVFIMAPASTATREAPASPNDRAPAPHRPAQSATHNSTHNTGRPIPARPSRTATDDEILGLDPAAAHTTGSVGVRRGGPGADTRRDAAHPASTTPASESDDPWREDDPAHASAPAPSSPDDRQRDAEAMQQSAEPESLRATLDANPELRRAWDDAQAYRESFASPDDARDATALLADLDRMDALFFSRRPEDHAELARAVASLDPAAFASLAQAMSGLATGSANAPRKNFPVGAQHAAPGADAWRDAAHSLTAREDSSTAGVSPTPVPSTEKRQQDGGATQPTPAQTEFFHATNAAAVEGVLDAIESQVERLLPEGVSKSARNRVVGEIYRELDTTLRSNRQLAQQMRDAFRSGALDADHQRALVSLVTGRARQALPGVAKRVLNEWTSTSSPRTRIAAHASAPPSAGWTLPVPAAPAATARAP